MQQVRLPNGLEVYALNQTEPGVLYHEIFSMESYRKNGIDLADGACVFDIGANIGMYALFLGHSVSSLRLFAFEPIPAIFEVLQRNLSKLPETVSHKALNRGLSDRDRSETFTFDSSLSMTAGMYSDEVAGSVQTTASSYAWLQAIVQDAARVNQLPAQLASRLVRWLDTPYLRVPTRLLLGLPLTTLLAWQKRNTKTVTCSLTTLSAVIEKEQISQIDLAKIDVEGSEWDVLMGIAPADWPKIRQFVVEVHDIDQRTQRIADLFRQHGYRVTVAQEDWSLHKLMNIYTVYATST
ncbi:FkbM family methyltransferase [Fibrella arboris]|uniref:FkbM family methyltransferase n=1 Tax=Fibrella arboris TaxID=3242486 RepID=UPI003522CD68